MVDILRQQQIVAEFRSFAVDEEYVDPGHGVEVLCEEKCSQEERHDEEVLDFLLNVIRKEYFHRGLSLVDKVNVHSDGNGSEEECRRYLGG